MLLHVVADDVASTDDSAPTDVIPASVYAIALDLGWEVAGLYSALHVPRSKSAGHESEPDVGEAPPQFLPTLSELSPAERTRLSLGRIRVALHRLTHVFVAADVDVPTIDAAVAAFDGSELVELKAELANVHEELLCGLHVVDPNLGKSYDLGRALVYTCQRPSSWAEVRNEFQRFRLTTLSSWLADLSTYLPDHACRAVAISLGIWQEAIPDPGQRAHAGQLELDLGSEAEKRLLRQLRRQGGLWRNVLTAAKDPRQMLGAGDYAAAVGRVAKRGLRLLFSWRTYFLVPVVLVAGGVAIYFILSSGGQEINKIVGAIAAGAGTLGITVSGAKTTVGRWASKLEQPLWAAEIDVAIGGAITTLDRGWVVRFRQRPSRIAAAIAPARGPSAE